MNSKVKSYLAEVVHFSPVHVSNKTFVFLCTVQGLPEKDVISSTIAFLSLQNANGMETLSKTEQFIYTMIAFLGKKNAFLDADMKMLLSKFVQTTFTSHAPLDFDADSCNKFNFENLYIAFLDHFQGESYGDRTFGQLVMVPLAQKHNIKWRKMIWSEHLHALRFVYCSETEVKFVIFLIFNATDVFN